MREYQDCSEEEYWGAKEIAELRELNAELLSAAKAVAGAITEREQTQAMADLMAAIAKADGS